jgi:hypothetical protein
MITTPTALVTAYSSAETAEETILLDELDLKINKKLTWLYEPGRINFDFDIEGETYALFDARMVSLVQARLTIAGWTGSSVPYIMPNAPRSRNAYGIRFELEPTP